MLIYLDSEQANLLIDILEGTIFHEELVDWSDYKQDNFGRMVRIERPDLIAASESRVKLCKDLIEKLEAMI